MKKNRFLSLIFGCFFLLNSGFIFADSQMACEAILCMSGGWANEKGFQQCAPSIQAFGQVKIYTQRGFDGELTRAARAIFLESCTNADKTFVRQALMMYGDKEYIDINL